VRIAGDRGRSRGTAAEMVAVDVVGRPGGSIGRGDQRVELQIVQRLIEPVLVAPDDRASTPDRDTRGSTSGPFASAFTRMSCAKYGISRSRFLLLNSITSSTTSRIHRAPPDKRSNPL
jgi:hypothetical protein